MVIKLSFEWSIYCFIKIGWIEIIGKKVIFFMYHFKEFFYRLSQLFFSNKLHSRIPQMFIKKIVLKRFVKHARSKDITTFVIQIGKIPIAKL